VVCFFMALLSSRGISTPSLKAQGEQRRSSLFNIPRDNPHAGIMTAIAVASDLGVKPIFDTLSGLAWDKWLILFV
jgi:hypothetical protein